MLKFLLLILLGAGLFYYGWDKDKPSVTLEDPIVTLEEGLAAIRSQGSCSAQELAEIAEKDPQAVEKALKGCMLSVSGTLSKALIKGVSCSDLILELEGSADRKINFCSDFQEFTRMIEGFKNGEFKFQKFGNEIVLIPPKRASTISKAGGGGKEKAAKTFDPIVKLREGEPLTLKGLFQHVGTKTVQLRLREMP